MTHTHEATTLADLTQIASRCLTIEASFEATKGEGGLDSREVRMWIG